MDTVLPAIADEIIRTVVALATTAIVGVVVWLGMLKTRSGRIRALISGSKRSFVLYFRVDADATYKSKPISFEKCGAIGLGRHQNECTWYVSYGTLSIYNANGKQYSNFKWDKATGRLVHTNNPKLPSVMGQYIVPLSVPDESVGHASTCCRNTGCS